MSTPRSKRPAKSENPSVRTLALPHAPKGRQLKSQKKDAPGALVVKAYKTAWEEARSLQGRRTPRPSGTWWRRDYQHPAGPSRGEEMTIRVLALLVEGTRFVAPLLSPVLSGCGSGPLQPLARLIALEQAWADESYATFAENSSRPTSAVRGPSFTEEVRCSQRLR